MKIQFEHPEEVEIEQVLALAQSGHIKTSPHVGNLDQGCNPHYLALALAGVQLELVDTISSNDRNGRPANIVKAGEETVLECGLSNKMKKRTHPCVVNVGNTELSLTDFHTQPLVSAGIDFELSSRFPSRVHPDLPEALVVAMSRLTPEQGLRDARSGMVSQDPKDRIKPSIEAISALGVYGSSVFIDDQLSGIILPVQAIMAAEVVEQAIRGSDRTFHIGGSDMVVYTRDPKLADSVQSICILAMEVLGLKNSLASFRFSVINKNGGIRGLDDESKKLSSEIGFDNFSQHDLV